MYAAKTAMAQYQQIDRESAVNGASPHQLIQMLMHGALQRLDKAREAIAENNIPLKGEMLGKATSIIGGLQASLDKSQAPELCESLDGLYGYMQRRLLEANVRNDPAMIEEVRQLLSTVKEGWDELASDNASESITE
jgi:flagellar protein FliS